MYGGGNIKHDKLCNHDDDVMIFANLAEEHNKTCPCCGDSSG